MRKVLIKLYVPAINKTFDLFAPLDLEIEKLIEILVNGVIDLTDDEYFKSNQETLNIKKSQLLLDPKCTLTDYGVDDGAEIMLI